MGLRRFLIALLVSIGVLGSVLAASSPALAAPSWTKVADKISDVARKEVGTVGTGADGNCVKYGPGCQPWCSYFATWVWDKAGVGPGGGLRKFAYSGELYRWGQRKNLDYGKNIKANVKRGDAVFFGSGPSNSLHVALVVKVWKKGMDLIEGNYLKDGKWQVVKRYVKFNTGWQGGFYGGVHPSSAYLN